MDHNLVEKGAFAKLQNELKVARSEICNLRQQVRALKYTQERGLESLSLKLKSWSCEGCQSKKEEAGSSLGSDDGGINFTPVGFVSTVFPKKKGVPRQPGVCTSSHAKVVLFNTIFTNPEHALEGLSEFSHMWILFHFDRNESKHLHAKVAPPRLNGERTGVFATRSPHRPCPIGLSLVKIEYIEGKTIYFSGVDMLDGTPVLDIKPFIPQYDDPLQQGEACGVQEDTLEVKEIPVAPGSPGISPGHREAPDGEESDEDGPKNTVANSLAQAVRVPSWVKSTSPIEVELTADAKEQLVQMDKMYLWPVIENVLKEDPRSTYLKQRYSNQFYTFLISNLNVSCKFNDSLNTVNVYRFTQISNVCECGEPEWQCMIHGNKS